MGLPGLLLTLSDMQRAEELVLVGPEDSGRLLRLLQRSLRRPPFPVRVLEGSAGSPLRVDLGELAVTCLRPEGELLCYLCETTSLPGRFDVGERLPSPLAD